MPQSGPEVREQLRRVHTYLWDGTSKLALGPGTRGQPNIAANPTKMAFDAKEQLITTYFVLTTNKVWSLFDMCRTYILKHRRPGKGGVVWDQLGEPTSGEWGSSEYQVNPLA